MIEIIALAVIRVLFLGGCVLLGAATVVAFILHWGVQPFVILERAWKANR